MDLSGFVGKHVKVSVFHHGAVVIHRGVLVSVCKYTIGLRNYEGRVVWSRRPLRRCDDIMEVDK